MERSPARQDPSSKNSEEDGSVDTTRETRHFGGASRRRKRSVSPRQCEELAHAIEQQGSGGRGVMYLVRKECTNLTGRIMNLGREVFKIRKMGKIGVGGEGEEEGKSVVARGNRSIRMGVAGKR